MITDFLKQDVGMSITTLLVSYTGACVLNDAESAQNIGCMTKVHEISHDFVIKLR